MEIQLYIRGTNNVRILPHTMDTVCETPCLLDSSVGMATQDPFFL